MMRITALCPIVLAIAALAGCSYSAGRTVTTTAYTPERTVTTTTHLPANVTPPDSSTSQIVTTVRRNPDGSVTRTTTRYYTPLAGYSYYSTDDATLASEVRSTIRQDPEVTAHTRNMGVGTDAGVVEITGTADSISTIQQASWDALQVPGVTEVNNDMVIDTTSPG
jgi:BON domain